MHRVLLAKGAVGEIVRRFQHKLGFTALDADGWYGQVTHDAVLAFQRDHHLSASGEVDTATWRAVMAEPVPSVDHRSLQLTAHFEGHGFALAQGNFDGAGITWGVIGFTLKSGEIGRIVLEIDRTRRDLLDLAFASLADDIVAVMKRPWSEQLAFADSVSLGAKKVRLAEPWLTCFRRFGEMAEIQELQRERARLDYAEPATETAAEYGLASELGRALAFDIHVQNGGIRSSARARIAAQLQGQPPPGEPALRAIIANAVADVSSARFRADVRSRKMAIATGAGEVHGWRYTLRNWGLQELP
jgi:hypothetical protein